VPAAALDDISGALDLAAQRIAANGRDAVVAGRLSALARGLDASSGDAVTRKRTAALAATLNDLAQKLQ
jgi:hypothetical protein